MFDKIKDFVTGASGGKGRGSATDAGGYGQYLQGISWPASKEEVLTALRENGAQDSLISHVESMAGDRFSGADDLVKGLR